jgi:hypothetical protein
MKKSSSILIPGIAALLFIQGCAPEDQEYAGRRRGGFRPPSHPAFPEDPYAQQADPLNFPPGYQSPAGSSAGTAPSYSAVNPHPTPDPRPAPSPAPSSQSAAPAPAPNPPPAPPKSAEPQYATKVPGKPGWIRSPYDGKLLDATGFLRGEQVADPHTGKIMLVP